MIEEKPLRPEFSRGTDGRFLPRYHGLKPPRHDPAFDKEARQVFVDGIVSALPEDQLRPLAEAAGPLGLLVDEFLVRFEHLCWWGLRRKEPWVEIFAGYGPNGGCVVTPEGFWCIGRVGWRKRAAVKDPVVGQGVPVV